MNNFIHNLKVKISDLRLKYELSRAVKQGYISNDGTPLKCYKCNSTNLEEYDEYWEEYWCVEFSVKCKDCGTKLGHWSYGSWEV